MYRDLGGYCSGTSVFVTPGGAPGIKWVGARDVAQPLTSPRTAPHRERLDPGLSEVF